nr:hypothetical protein [Thermoanaerobaculales bacterium]
MTPTILGLVLAASTATAPAGLPDGVFDPPARVRHQLEEGASKRAAFEASTASRPDGRKSWADPA